jgi:hypothetical protein
MCDPTGGVATYALIATTLAATAYNADIQKKQGEANAKGYEQQARIDQLGKADVLAQGDRESERMLWRTRQALGSQRAAIGAAGIDAGLGTPSELLGETAMFGEIEQQDVRLNAARQAWGYDVSAANNLTGADQARWGGKAQATGTILAGLGQAGGYAAQGYGSTRNPNSYRNNPGYIGPVTRQPIRY